MLCPAVTVSVHNFTHSGISVELPKGSKHQLSSTQSGWNSHTTTIPTFTTFQAQAEAKLLRKRCNAKRTHSMFTQVADTLGEFKLVKSDFKSDHFDFLIGNSISKAAFKMTQL